jgi:predicted MFS family arabinose efflux permease
LSAYRDRTYLFFIVLTMFFAACFFQLFTNMPVYFKRELKFSEPFIGVLMATNGLIIAFLEMVLVYKLERKGNILRYISLGVLLVGISFITLNIPDVGPILAFGMITLVTFGEIFAMPFMNTYWISRTHDTNRGEYAALYTMAWSAAQTLGPLFGAQLADKEGFKWLWWVTGFISLVVSICFWRMYRNSLKFRV